jgi:hypothetical protein
LLSDIEALLLHGETRPVTGLPARATSAASNVRKVCGGKEANRSLWPNSEVHEESLPAMPALLLVRVQNKHTTMAMLLAMSVKDAANVVRKRTG